MYNLVIRYLYNLWNDYPNKSSIHLTPYIVITILLTICPMLCFTYGPFKKKAWDSRSPDSLSHSLDWLSQPEVMGASLPSTGPLGWDWDCPSGAGDSLLLRVTSAAKIPLWFLTATPWCRTSWFTLCPSYQSSCGFFSYISGSSERWLFCSLVVILMWLWEVWSTAFTSSAILTRPHSRFWWWIFLITFMVMIFLIT